METKTLLYHQHGVPAQLLYVVSVNTDAKTVDLARADGGSPIVRGVPLAEKPTPGFATIASDMTPAPLPASPEAIRIASLEAALVDKDKQLATLRAQLKDAGDRLEAAAKAAATAPASTAVAPPPDSAAADTGKAKTK